MRRIATPGEISRWAAVLDVLDPERRDAVIAMLSEVVGDCPACDEPVRRCDARRLVGGRLAHVRCVDVRYDARAIIEMREGR
jgi:hypothetical protein